MKLLKHSKTWGSKCLALLAQLARAFGMNPKVGGSSPPQGETFSVSKTLTLSQKHCSCVENECCCPGTVNISNVNFASKYIYTTRASVQKHGTANVWPWWLKWWEHSAWIRKLGVRASLMSRHFLSPKPWHFHKNIRSCVENNDVSRAHLTFQKLSLLQNISIPKLPSVNG